MTEKNFSPGILKLLHIRFVENGFKLWYNYVNVNSICRYITLGLYEVFRRNKVTCFLLGIKGKNESRINKKKS